MFSKSNNLIILAIIFTILALGWCTPEVSNAGQSINVRDESNLTDVSLLELENSVQNLLNDLWGKGLLNHQDVTAILTVSTQISLLEKSIQINATVNDTETCTINLKNQMIVLYDIKIQCGQDALAALAGLITGILGGILSVIFKILF